MAKKVFNPNSKGRPFKKGGISWNKGLTKETDSRVDYFRPTAVRKGQKGSLAPAWKGGRKYVPPEYGKEFDNYLKEQVRFRDKYTCQSCGCSQLENGRQLDVHHIDYDKKNSSLNNFVALCRNCHLLTNRNREYWKTIFSERQLWQFPSRKEPPKPYTSIQKNWQI